jgi:transposase, IS30 family
VRVLAQAAARARGRRTWKAGALRREPATCLRTGRALRRPRRKADQRQGRIKDIVMISERSAEAADRAVPGH